MSVTGTEPSIEELGDEIAMLSAGIGRALCRWLALVAAFDRREGWGNGQGFGSCAQWLAWRCGLSGRTARDHVRVAHWLEGVPLLRGAFADGTLSFSRVRALSRLAHVEDEAALLELALEASADQLERIVRSTRAVTRREACRQAEERRVVLHPDDDGTWVLRARLTAEEGERVLRALERAEEELFEPDGERVGAEVRRADALLHLVGGSGSAAATEVVVHVDAEALTAVDVPQPSRLPEPPAPGAGRCATAAGAPLAPAVARRLGCDAGIVAMVERDGEVLSVGRRTRAIPPALRRALEARQPTCAFPGCSRTRWLDAHHLVHWAHGGETKLSNLVRLCRHHHRALHEGGWSLERDEAGDRWLARSPEGWTLAPEPPELDPDAVPPVPPAGREVAARLRAGSAGQRWDLGLCVDAVLRHTTPPTGGRLVVPPRPPRPPRLDLPILSPFSSFADAYADAEVRGRRGSAEPPPPPAGSDEAPRP